MACKCDKYSSAMLRETVEFQRKSRTANGSGGFTETWAALSGAPVRAHVKAVSGTERFASDRVEASTRYRAVVRYFTGHSEEDRILFRGRYFNIRFINNVEFKDRWLEIDLDGGAAT